MFLLKVNRVYASVLTGCLTMFLSGASLTWSSPELLKLANLTSTPFTVQVTCEQLSWISSLMTFGAAIGPVLSGYLSDRIGRKHAMLSLGVPFLASYLIMACGKTVILFYFARILVGLSVGASFNIMPLYVGELAFKMERGSLLAILSTAVSLGYFFSYTLGPYVSVICFNLALAIFPVAFLVLFLLLGVESPYYYISKNSDDLARSVLEKIRPGASTSAIDRELLDIQAHIGEIGQGTLHSLFKSKATVKALIIASGLLILQSLSGSGVIIAYTQTIFEQTKVNLSSDLCSIIIGLLQFTSSLVTLFIADRFGRKTLLIISAIIMLLSEVSLGIYCVLRDQGINVDSVSFVPILTLILFIISYMIGFGPIPWVILGEIFPLRMKAVASFIPVSISWMMTFITTKCFYLLIDYLGMGQTFIMFACCCLMAALFSKFVVVETRGRSLEEIQDILNHRQPG